MTLSCASFWIGLQIRRPRRHELATLFQRVRAPIGGLRLVLDGVRQGRLNYLAGERRLSPAQSRNDDRKPWVVTLTCAAKHGLEGHIAQGEPALEARKHEV